MSMWEQQTLQRPRLSRYTDVIERMEVRHQEFKLEGTNKISTGEYYAPMF